jgi:hypothetical protein
MVVVPVPYVTLNRLQPPDRGTKPEVGDEATCVPA